MVLRSRRVRLRCSEGHKGKLRQDIAQLAVMRPSFPWPQANRAALEISMEPGGKGSFQAFKLQRPARTTVCSHSMKDMTATFHRIKVQS
jgi:hypothetical protein